MAPIVLAIQKSKFLLTEHACDELFTLSKRNSS